MNTSNTLDKMDAKTEVLFSHLAEPGGYIQWAEYDMTTQTIIKASPDLSSTALDAIPAFVQGLKKKDERVGVQKYVFFFSF